MLCCVLLFLTLRVGCLSAIEKSVVYHSFVQSVQAGDSFDLFLRWSWSSLQYTPLGLTLDSQHIYK